MKQSLVKLAQGDRNVSLSIAMSGLSLESPMPESATTPWQSSPSKIPLPVTPKPKICVPSASPFLLPPLTPRPFTPPQSSLTPPEPISPFLSYKKSPPKFKQFLTRDTNTTAAWDPQEHMEQFETMYKDVCVKFNATASETEHLRDSVAIYKTSGKKEWNRFRHLVSVIHSEGILLLD